MANNIFFDPWVGDKYGSELSIFREKILILGNSHYCDICEDCGNRELHPDCVDFTKRVVRVYLDTSQKDTWKKTFSTFVNCMLNKSTSNEERMEFFDSVAFYNYLQIAAGEDPYSTGQYDYTDVRYLEAFYEVVDKIQPDVVICWGNKVWEALPNNWNNYGEAKEGLGIKIDGDVFNKYLTYPYEDGHKILLIGVQHPSQAFPRDYYHHVFSELIFD